MRTTKIFLIFSALYFVVLSPSLIWDSYLQTPLGLAATLPYFSIYLFHNLGMPGLLENNGVCGWGWCSPTTFGWCFLILFWLSIMWLISLALTKLITKRK